MADAASGIEHAGEPGAGRNPREVLGVVAPAVVHVEAAVPLDLVPGPPQEGLADDAPLLGIPVGKGVVSEPAGTDDGRRAAVDDRVRRRVADVVLGKTERVPVGDAPAARSCLPRRSSRARSPGGQRRAARFRRAIPPRELLSMCMPPQCRRSGTGGPVALRDHVLAEVLCHRCFCSSEAVLWEWAIHQRAPRCFV